MRPVPALGLEAGKRNRWLPLAAALLVAVAEAHAQEKLTDGAVAKGKTQPVRRIVISVPDRRLALFEDGRVVKTYRVAVGAPDTPSPEGEFSIVNRIADPTYYAPGVVVPAGPENPLGTRWLGLSLKGFGIHGTNRPRSVGHFASHGCVRMRKHDIEELFALVRSGDVVELHTRRTPEIMELFDTLHAPAHGTVAAAVAAQAAEASAGSANLQ